MIKKPYLFLLLLPLISQANIKPENVISASCLKSYQKTYQTLKTHKAFSYARESKTGKDRCGWGYGYNNIEDAKKSAMKQCAKHHLNAECMIVDVDGKFLVKKGDFSFIAPPNNTPLSTKEEEALINEAKMLIQGNCLPFFKKYLKENGHKVFAYSLDGDGKYACGKSTKSAVLKIAEKNSLNACKKNKNKRGENRPKSPCKPYAHGNKIILKSSDFGITLTAKSDKYLSSEEYKNYLNKSKEIINEGPCLYQMKYYLRGSQHQAYYLAVDKEGKQVCGRAEGAFTPQVAKDKALKKCQKSVKKNNLKATCKLYAQNFNIVGKSEDFGIKQGKDDYLNAIHRGNLIKVKQYVAEGMDINAISKKDGMTALFLTVAQGDEEFFNLLVKKGADINHKAKDGSSLLIAASLGKNPNIVRTLLDKGLDINAKGMGGNTPLHSAFMMMDTYLAGLYMQEGADANIKNSKGLSGYDLAKKWKMNLDELKTIDPKKPDHDGTLPLFYAAKKGDRAMIKKLIKLGADVDHTDDRGYSPISITKDKDIMKLLISLGSNINAKDSEGATPLMEEATSEFNKTEKLKILLSLGADKNLKNNNGKTAYDLVKDDKTTSDEIKQLVKP